MPDPFRRIVLYVPGFDPFPARRYRELYRREAADQGAITGHQIKVFAGSDTQAWHVDARVDGRRVETEFQVLGWSDIVRAQMAQGNVATYWHLLRTAWIYVSTGALFRLMRLRKGPTLAALYPVGMLLAQAGLAVAAAIFLTGLLWQVSPVLAGLAALGSVWMVFRLGRFADRWTYVYYLMLNYAYTSQHFGAYDGELDARIDHFASQIAAALQSGVDEVLVVGHSSGAQLAVSAVARVPDTQSTALGLLTLGHVVPMLSALPRAQGLREDLRHLSVRRDLTWVDVTAPGDGACFALCDPVAVSGMGTPAQRGPLVISAQFSKSLAPRRWRALRWRFFRLHFQYLCAFDHPGAYDYFSITAGPRTLEQRFETRQPSRGRITRPVLAQQAA